ncbi:MAG: hypothetical protein QM760_10470 [Nibricoccus sp.]
MFWILKKKCGLNRIPLCESKPLTQSILTPILKSKSASSWSAAKSEEHYGFKRWGAGHIGVDDAGFVNVQPLADGRCIRIMDVANEAIGMGLKAPMVIRFQDLLRHRVTQINEAFRKAIKEENYKGDYRGVFPIKVNQLREVVDEIVAAGKAFNYGIEAGSKPEADAGPGDARGLECLDHLQRL